MKLGEIMIRMERPLDTFSKDEQAQFIRDLSFHAGVLPEEMINPTFHRGCTIFESEFNREAVRYLIDVFENMLKSDECAYPTELRNFLERYKVSLITGNVPRFGESFQEGEDSENPLVIFVHGWSGDDESFGKFPEFISERAGIESLVYAYPSGSWTHSPHIYLIARNLDNWIRNNSSKRPLVFIAHSMGGLVVRKLITAQHWRSEPLDSTTRHITFIASPHTGVSWASLSKYVPSLRKAQLRELSPDSPVLMDLNEQWLAWSRRNIPENCSSKSIYGSKDVVVSLNSALSIDQEGIPILGKGHIDIVKPEDIEDEIVVTEHRLLKEAGVLR